MNRWQCEHPGCDASAVGCGGAVGLRAIGWYFEVGPGIRCPAHRPDPMPCADKYSKDNHGKSCSLCRAESEAEQIQEMLTAVQCRRAATMGETLEQWAGLTQPQRTLLALLPPMPSDGKRCTGATLRTAMALADKGLAKQVADRRYVLTKVGREVARVLEGRDHG